MRIYTGTGDQGETGLLGGARCPKDTARVEAYGSVDELNAVLGWCRCCPDLAPLGDLLLSLQSDLFRMGAVLATPAEVGRSPETWSSLEEEDVRRLEAAIDRVEEALPALRQFILPGGTEGAARLHIARAVCRRAERRIVTLARHDPPPPEVLRYLNRLSDLLFVLARESNARQGVEDVPWVSPHRSAR